MGFDETYRMQLDIETYTEGGFPDALRPEDRIIVVALTDNRGWECALHAKDHDEASILRELVRTIRQKDPDIIEGHNIFNFDLDYILKRCQLHNIKFKVGRDGSEPRTYISRGKVGDTQVEYNACAISDGTSSTPISCSRHTMSRNASWKTTSSRQRRSTWVSGGRDGR